MQKPYPFVLVILIVTATVLVFGLIQTDGSIHGTMYLAVNLVGAGMISVVFAAASLVFWVMKLRPARNYSLLAAICALITAGLPIVVQRERIEETEQELTALYDRLAANGSPFPAPEQLDWEPDHPALLVPHGYRVSEDRQTFEVYYHASSDSRILAYPQGQWEWLD